MKNARILALLLVLPAHPAFASAQEVQTGEPHSGVSLTLRSLASEYAIDDVRRGAVEFRASIGNGTDAPLTVAHPTICPPPDRREGEAWHFRDSHGRSEILLTVRKPDGSTVALRDGTHFFEPGNVPLLTIQPGESRDITIGWFFQHSRMIWEDGLLAASLFLERGPYRVSLLFRNSFPRAMVYDPATKSTDFMEVWTGELNSNEVALEVR